MVEGQANGGVLGWLDSVGLALLALLYFAVTLYLPTKLHLLGERIHWYIYGSEVDNQAAY